MKKNRLLSYEVLRNILLLFLVAGIVIDLIFLYQKIQEKTNLFAYIPVAQTIPSEFAAKSSVVSLNDDVLANGNVTLNLLENENIKTTISRKNINGYSVFTGKVENHGEIVIVKVNDVYMGYIYTDKNVYQLHGLGNNAATITQVDEKKIPKEDPEQFSLIETPSFGTRKLAATSTAVVIDVSIFYSNDAVNVIGGESKIPAHAALAVASTNQAFINSGIGNISMQLVYAGKYDYAEGVNFDWNNTLSQMMDSSNVQFAELRARRDLTAADTSTLMVANSRYCGLSNVLHTENALQFRTNAVNIVNVFCAEYNLSYGHEIGHLFGAGHDSKAGCHGLYSYSCGFIAEDKSFRTIMAYPSNCGSTGCPKRNVFSGPGGYNGQPTGNALSANNAGTVANAAQLIASLSESTLTNHVYLPLIAH